MWFLKAGDVVVSELEFEGEGDKSVGRLSLLLIE